MWGEGGEEINSVPSSARAELDVRLTAGVNTREILRRIRACVDDCEGISIADVSWSVGSYERVDGPLVDAVSEVAEEVTGDRVYRRSATGGGDAKKFRNAGMSTVEFGLGTETAHAVDEYTTTAALEGNALVYAALPYRLHEATGDGDSDGSGAE
jgi:succinyl-diaminopimelate desuccinylase